ncbi:MAG: hypothetical protein WAX04_09660 [Oscillospiraceae bacterium]
MKDKKFKRTQIILLSCLIICMGTLVYSIYHFTLYDKHNIFCYLGGFFSVIGIILLVVGVIQMMIKRKTKH